MIISALEIRIKLRKLRFFEKRATQMLEGMRPVKLARYGQDV